MLPRLCATAGLISLALGGCAADPTRPRDATRALYDALAAGDGQRACSVLSRSTRKTLEEQHERPCAAAVLEAEVDTSGAQVRHIELAVTEAAVELANGRFVSLDSSGGR